MHRIKFHGKRFLAVLLSAVMIAGSLPENTTVLAVAERTENIQETETVQESSAAETDVAQETETVQESSTAETDAVQETETIHETKEAESVEDDSFPEPSQTNENMISEEESTQLDFEESSIDSSSTDYEIESIETEEESIEEETMSVYSGESEVGFEYSLNEANEAIITGYSGSDT